VSRVFATRRDELLSVFSVVSPGPDSPTGDREPRRSARGSYKANRSAPSLVFDHGPGSPLRDLP